MQQVGYLGRELNGISGAIPETIPPEKLQQYGAEARHDSTALHKAALAFILEHSEVLPLTPDIMDSKTLRLDRFWWLALSVDTAELAYAEDRCPVEMRLFGELDLLGDGYDDVHNIYTLRPESVQVAWPGQGESQLLPDQMVDLHVDLRWAIENWTPEEE